MQKKVAKRNDSLSTVSEIVFVLLDNHRAYLTILQYLYSSQFCVDIEVECSACCYILPEDDL